MRIIIENENEVFMGDKEVGIVNMEIEKPIGNFWANINKDMMICDSDNSGVVVEIPFDIWIEIGGVCPECGWTHPNNSCEQFDNDSHAWDERE